MAKGDLILRMKAHVAQARKNIQSVNNQLRRMGVTARGANRSVTGLSSGLSGMAGTLMRFAAPAVGLYALKRGVTAATTAFADMTRHLKQAMLIAGESPAKFEKIQIALDHLAADLARPPKDLIDNWKGTRSILDTTNESIEATRHVTELLMTKVGDAGPVAVTFASIMKEWGVEAEELKVKIDQIISRSAFQNLNDWNEAMEKAVSAGKGLKLTVDEVLIGAKVFMDTLRNAPIAGQRFKMYLNKLSKDITPEAEKALKKMGVSIEEVNPEIVGMSESLKRLAAANWELVAPMTEVFGARAALDVVSVLRKIREGIIDVDKSMGLTVPNIEAYRGKMKWLLEGTRTDIDRLKVEWRILLREMGAVIGPPMADILKGITTGLQITRGEAGVRIGEKMIRGEFEPEYKYQRMPEPPTPAGDPSRAIGEIRAGGGFGGALRQGPVRTGAWIINYFMGPVVTKDMLDASVTEPGS